MPPPAIRTGHLDVYLLGRLAGCLDYSSRGNEMHFAYDSGYASDPSAQPLSFSLPVRSEPYGTERTTEFFANLLPPEVVRRKLGPILHLSRHNVFGFLEALGADCAGAVSLRRPTDPAPEVSEERLLELDDAEAAAILASLPKRPLYAGGIDGYRISGSGAQDKLLVRLSGDRISLPLFGAPSTHLLKPPAREYPDSVFNEWFTMSLAARVGLPAPHCGIVEIGGRPCYWIERFDRVRDASGRVLRLHQEDFCQMLGINGECKYESEGGPSVAASMRALREMRLGMRHEMLFLDMVAFHVLTGNADAHGKNYAILYEGGKAGLAPVYDALCTSVYPALSREAAMSVGSERRLDKIDRTDFAKMASEIGVSPALVLRRLGALADRIVPAVKALRAECAALHPSPVFGKIEGVVEQQAARLATRS
jgi:serine/threonine-protein kinase HipA